MLAAATPSRHEPRRGPRDWLSLCTLVSLCGESLSGLCRLHFLASAGSGPAIPPNPTNGAREKVVHTQHTRLPRQPGRSFFTANEGVHYVYSAHLAFVQHAPGTRAAPHR